LIFSSKSGFFLESSRIENERIVISILSLVQTAFAILFHVSQNKAISPSISSAFTSQSITFSQSTILETSKAPVFKIYIAFASSPSLKRTSHSLKDLS
jgi:ABC-type enterochelin transport system permease subunit